MDSFGTLQVDERYEPTDPLGSRLAYRYMFAELLGTMIFTIISCGTDMSSGTLASSISYRETLSPGRVLVVALGNGLAWSALMYMIYSFLKLRFRTSHERFKPLTNMDSDVHQKVFIRGKNKKGWIKATVESASLDAPGYLQVRTMRTDMVKRCCRDDVRAMLFEGDIARTEKDQDVEILSKELNQMDKDRYDCRHYDGRITKEGMWQLRLPSRDVFIVGHFNPAVTYAAALLGEIKPAQAIMYIAAQIFGGILGAAFVKAILPDFGTNYYGVSTLSSDISNLQGILAETMFTSILVLMILTAFLRPWSEMSVLPHPFFREMVPILLGLTLFCLTVMGATTTGAPMNIARSFGAAFVTDEWSSHWVFALSAWLGCLLGAFLWATFFSGKVHCSIGSLFNVVRRDLIFFLFVSAYESVVRCFKKGFCC